MALLLHSVVFFKEFETDLKESTVHTRKKKYLAEVGLKKRAGEVDINVTSLTVKKRGRPLMLGEKLDKDVKHYLKAVREGGGVITTAITMASATAIVEEIEIFSVNMEVLY